MEHHTSALGTPPSTPDNGYWLGPFRALHGRLAAADIVLIVEPVLPEHTVVSHAQHTALTGWKAGKLRNLPYLAGIGLTSIIPGTTINNSLPGRHACSRFALKRLQTLKHLAGIFDPPGTALPARSMGRQMTSHTSRAAHTSLKDLRHRAKARLHHPGRLHWVCP